jgi:hypothetical protein
MEKEFYNNLTSFKKWNTELCTINRSGEKFYLNVNIYLVMDDKRTLINAIIISEDITEEKNLVYELSLKNEELKN